jgi:hypothetical protein
VKIESNLAESSKEGYGSKRAVLPMMMMMMMGEPSEIPDTLVRILERTKAVHSNFCTSR